MTEALDSALDQFEQGVIDRRGLLTKLAVLLGGAAVAGKTGVAEAASTDVIMPLRSINHFHIEVSDLKRSHDFYAQVFGAKLKSQSEAVWTMTFPDSTKTRASWVSLSKGVFGHAGTYSHIGLGVDVPTV